MPSVTWDLAAYFPSVTSPEFRAFADTLAADLAAVAARAAAAPDLRDDTAASWEELVLAWEQLARRVDHLGSYVGCVTAADANDEVARAAEGRVSLLDAEVAKIRGEVIRAVGAAAPAVFDAFVARPGLAGAAHALRQLRRGARHRMAPALERLASDLAVDGLQAWGRLYDTVAGELEFDMTFPDGERRPVPMAQRRSLCAHPDRRIRREAHEAGQKPWIERASTFAAALNALSGQRLALQRNRGVGHFLDGPLLDSALERGSLEAMFAAIDSLIELPRKVLRAHARLQGTPALAWYDLEAPQVPQPAGAIPWDAACDLVGGAFRRGYPALGAYFDGLLRDRWIESEARPGKRPGAFCTHTHLLGQERIFMTHGGALGDVVTLAHEAGHAWHAYLLRGARGLATNYPMTLAETASNFGEMILLQSLLDDPAVPEAQKLALLDNELQRASIYLLNIPARFQFEHDFHTARASGELGTRDLCALMVNAQRRLYGDTLETGAEDPYFWASKLHFYIASVGFYNFPYTVGYLLGTALFARFRAEGPSYLARYEEFLRRTGSATCEELAEDILGVDLGSPAFWMEGITPIGPTLARFEKLAGAGR